MRKLAKVLILAWFILTTAFLAMPRLVELQRVFADGRSNQPVPPAPGDVKYSLCQDANESGLPLPSSFRTPEEQARFQKMLWDFLDKGKYVELGWCKDKWVRDTGPFVNAAQDDGPFNNPKYQGTHPAVRVYYSPLMMKWLVGGRIGAVPDGAMIIKEQYNAISGDPNSGPPAVRYQEMTEKEIKEKWDKFKDWTIMIKDSAASKDGWFWSELYTGMPQDSYEAPFRVLSGGFGQYCARCHSSAENEFTFASLANIEGFPGMPLTFFIDHSWRPDEDDVPAEMEQPANHPKSAPPGDGAVMAKAAAPAEWPVPPATMSNFKKFFARSPEMLNRIKTLPGENYDHIYAGPKGAEEFLTSNQCWWCHTGNNTLGAMFTTGSDKSTPANISPYAEWRWSPMGLAGRDPIFFAQLESEINFLETTKDPAKREQLKTQVTNLCFRCHGVMGKRQLDADHGYDPTSPDKTKKEPDFKLDFVYNTDMTSKGFKYGALARDGVSCTVCHHTVEDKQPGGNLETSLDYFLKNNITGQFKTGKADELIGPFKDDEIITRPMDQTLGIKPKYDSYIQNPRLCGSCHTIDLPILDKPDCGQPGASDTDCFSIEQATYLEWLNSEFQTEYPATGKNPKGQTCQDCHMPTTFNTLAANGAVVKIPYRTQMATIEDNNYPASEHRAPYDDINVRFRKEGFARHQFQGMNLFMVSLFANSNLTKNYGTDTGPAWANPILGIRMNDWMVGGFNLPFSDVPAAVDNFIQQAKNDTADVDVTMQASNEPQKLVADVKVTNKTGHRLPSGVGFRRAFIELKVTQKDADGKEYVVWGSGLTNNIGAIVDLNACRNSLNKKRLTEEEIEQCTDVLPSERVGLNAPGGKAKAYQPHFYAPYTSEGGARASHDAKCAKGPQSNPITSEGEVQIYEELVKDATGNFTTSFIRRDQEFKDTRLLPRGWKKDGADLRLKGRYLEATHPVLVDKAGQHLCSDTDRYYTDGSGTSVVRYIITLPAGVDPKTVTITATLQYQSIPPYFLGQRFEGVLPGGPSTATERLCFLTAYADLTKSVANLSQYPDKALSTPIKNWRFPIASKWTTVR